MISFKNCENTDNQNKSEDIKNINVSFKNVKDDEIADFAKAMDATGFGLFNLILFLIVIVTACATSFETTTTSYILPIAECDLMLTLRSKGVLNASTYAGMVVSALLWGYLSDTQGRKKLLVICLLADAICVFASSLSQNIETLIFFKFLGGIMSNGPSSIIFTYVTEVHGSKFRQRAAMFSGMALRASTVFLPLLAWAILPRDWDFLLFNALNVHSWQMFLLVSAIPSVISGFAFMFLPESPKFLMSQGRNMEALRAFQKIYVINTRKPRESYPIKQLIEEVPSRDGNINEAIYTIESNKLGGSEINYKKMKRPHRSFSESMHDGMAQIKPLFRKPLLGHAIHIYVMQFCILLGMNTIRLWLPQLFASFSEYETIKTPEDSSNLCKILEYSVNKTATMITDYEEKCAVRPKVSLDMYTNNIIVSLSAIVGYGLGGTIVKMIGGKRLIIYGLFIATLHGFGLYWSVNSLSTLIISSVFLTVSGVSSTSLLNTCIEIFPTTLRNLIVASCLMFGRFGALTGNMIFPVLVELGCVPPFLMVGSVLLFASGLACVLPSDKKTTFK